MSYQQMVEVLAPLDESTRRQIIEEHRQAIFSNGFVAFICDNLNKKRTELHQLKARMLPETVQKMRVGMESPGLLSLQIEDFEKVRGSMNVVWNTLLNQTETAQRSH